MALLYGFLVWLLVGLYIFFFIVGLVVWWCDMSLLWYWLAFPFSFFILFLLVWWCGVVGSV